MVEISTIMAAIATAIISFYAWKAHQLTVAIKQKDAAHQQEIKDLFQAIVISNILSGPHEVGSSLLESRITQFNQWYNGNIQIFPKEKYFERKNKGL
jgi:hypothetical protein